MSPPIMRSSIETDDDTQKFFIGKRKINMDLYKSQEMRQKNE